LITAVANVFAVPWRSRLAALAWGMVVFLAGRAIVIHLASLLPGGGATGMRVAVMLSVLVAEAFWIVAFARSEAPVPLLREDTIEQLHRLLRLLRHRRQQVSFCVRETSGLQADCVPTRSITRGE